MFTTTRGILKESRVYHRRLAEMIANKKGENYSKTISWNRTIISFSLLRSSLVCLRGSRLTERRPLYDLNCTLNLNLRAMYSVLERTSYNNVQLNDVVSWETS